MRRTIIVMSVVAVSFMLSGIVIGVSMNASGQTAPIPSWIKNTALWWGQGQISDDEFIKAIQWLVDQKIISLPNNKQMSSSNIATPTTSNINTNPLSTYLPTQNDMGSQWQLQGQPTKSSNFDSNGATETIEQVYVKTITTAPNTVATVDIGQFTADNVARSVFSDMAAYWKQQQFTQWQFQTGTPLITCTGIARTTIQSTAIDLLCIEGKTLLGFEVNGNGIGNADEMDNLANITFKKMPLDVALQ